MVMFFIAIFSNHLKKEAGYSTKECCRKGHSNPMAFKLLLTLEGIKWHWGGKFMHSMSNTQNGISLLGADAVLMLQVQHTPAEQNMPANLHTLIEAQMDGLFADIARQRKTFLLTGIAELKIKSLSEAEIAGEFFSSLFPEPSSVKLGIMELMLNAIEHGNLEITSEEKNTLLRENRWIEEIEKRLTYPEYQHRYVRIQCIRHHAYTEITITDDGKGFDWSTHLDISNEKLTDIAGRGIACAYEISFDKMCYIGKGNIVKARQYSG
jgi:anti-sigma regulatory factor (Ser/Thr protein kinase)